MIYTCKATKIALYINTGRKSITQIKAETGADAIINGGLYDMTTFEPVCHLKVDGKVLVKDQWKYFGFAWNTNKMELVSDYSAYQNYICCVCMVQNGQAVPMYYDSALSGYRPRTAIGVFEDGRVWLYADTAGKTPEQLQKLAIAAGVKDAIMLDGGGSTQHVFPEKTLTAQRNVHNYICVWTEKEDDTMFKIALGAGHGLKTPGKRCDKALDPNETSEWWLNDRICDKVETLLKDYEGYQLLRLDDSDDGKDDVALASRTTMANNWKADVYVSVHHNAGAFLTNAGGICVYSYPGSKKGAQWRDAMYDALIDHTGLRGNRATPKLTDTFYVLKHTNMPAVLLELGFMDSKIDVPIILTEEFADQCAQAIVEVLVIKGRLKKKTVATPVMYRVQVGAFQQKAGAETLVKQLKAAGYQAYITKTEG